MLVRAGLSPSFIVATDYGTFLLLGFHCDHGWQGRGQVGTLIKGGPTRTRSGHGRGAPRPEAKGHGTHVEQQAPVLGSLGGSVTALLNSEGGLPKDQGCDNGAQTSPKVPDASFLWMTRRGGGHPDT